MRLDTLLYTRGTTHVTRYHSTPTCRSSNVAEHSYGVANIVIFLAGGNPSVSLLKAALHHDVAEVGTGDIPAPVKRASRRVKETLDGLEQALNDEYGLLQEPLTVREAALLKFADSYEGLLYSMEEYDMGNTLVLPVLHKWVAYLYSMEEYPRMSELMQHYYEWAKLRSIL